MEAQIAQKIADFFAKYPLRRCDKNQMLIYASDEPSGIFYLEKGLVRQYDISPQGEEIVVNVFKPPAFFPMAWAVTGLPNRYFYETSQPTAVRVAPAQATIEFLKSNPDVMFDLLFRVYSGTEGMQRRMAHLMGGSARTRVAFELVTECKRFGEMQPNGSCLIKIHEDELARRAGLSRETVNRELSKLKAEKLLDVSHKNLVVRDVAELEQTLGDEL